MKTLKLFFVVVIIGLFPWQGNAQNSKWKTDTIKVSSQCKMCKARIEEALAFEKGVKTSNVNLEKDVTVVTYNTKRTSLENIRKAISTAGYDADEVKADPKAYAKLSICCKKPEDQKKDGNHHAHGESCND